MFFIIGISSGEKQLDYTKTVICSQCGGYGRYQVFMTYMYFSFFFIPLFKWNRRFYVKTSCCNTVYELDSETGRRLLRGQEVDITEGNLTLVQTGRRTITWHTTKRCQNCGYEAEEEFAYCPKCGEKL